MTTDELVEWFERHNDEYLNFEKVEVKRSGRADLHTFILLDSLVPGSRDIIAASEHDEFYLSIRPEELAPVVTPEQIVELVRCGIRYDKQYSCLTMFA